MMLVRKSETRTTTTRVDCTLIARDDVRVWSIKPAADQF